jgi:hypothetical protein
MPGRRGRDGACSHSSARRRGAKPIFDACLPHHPQLSQVRCVLSTTRICFSEMEGTSRSPSFAAFATRSVAHPSRPAEGDARGLDLRSIRDSLCRGVAYYVYFEAGRTPLRPGHASIAALPTQPPLLCLASRARSLYPSRARSAPIHRMAPLPRPSREPSPPRFQARTLQTALPTGLVLSMPPVR